jgi:hypothetical protein
MSKNIAVYVPTRSSPEKFERTVDMLVGQSDSIENFDILAVIDDDQIDMYSHVVSKYPNIISVNPPHQGPNSPAIMKALFDFIETNDYYFIWAAADDWWGLSKGWDTAISRKKDIFYDGFYSLHTTNPLGRNLNALTTHFRFGWYPFHPGGSCRSAGEGKDHCTCWESNKEFPIIADPAYLIFHYHEMLPIATKKWWMAIRDFYDENYKGPDFVFLHAALAHVLSVYHGYSRLIETGVYFDGIQNDDNASKAPIAGMTSVQYYEKWAAEEKFAIIHPVAQRVAIDIFDHYSNIMCDARGIRRGPYKKHE